MAKITMLPGRGFIHVGGPEAVPFLQGLVSNDVSKVTPARAVYAALLTPQGKYLHDFFITANGEGLLLDCEAERLEDLLTRLKRFRLRSKVELTDVTDEWVAAAVWGDNALTELGLNAQTGAAIPYIGGVAYADPRHLGLGARLLVPSGREDAFAAKFEPAALAEYNDLRLSLGIASGAAELPVERAFLLESGFDELNGIDWQKGCYVGQEVTARTKYRGLLRRRLTPVAVNGVPEADDTRIMADGRDVGELRYHADGRGLALIKLESIASGLPLTCGGATLTPQIPDWWQLSDADADASATG